MYTKLVADGNIYRNDIYHHGKQNDEIIKMLIENNVVAPDYTIFEMLPVELYSTSLFAYLISSGIDINITFADSFTTRMMSVLELSIMSNNVTMVKFLLENKADVQINNDSPLSLAINAHHIEITNLLIEYGATLGFGTV
jgi:ankyrin repeat protein